MRIRDWSSDVCSSDLLVGIPLIGPRARRGLAWSAAVAVLLAVASIVFLGEHGATPQQGALPPAGAETRSGEWLHYGNDAGGSRFSPLRQIDATNLARLRSDERRGGKEWVSTFRFWWLPVH